MATPENIIHLWDVGQTKECFTQFRNMQPLHREAFIRGLYDKTFYAIASHDNCMQLMKFLLLKSTQEWN